MELIDRFTKLEHYVHSSIKENLKLSVLHHIRDYIKAAYNVIREQIIKIAKEDIYDKPILYNIRNLNLLLSHLMYGLTPAGFPKQRPETSYFLEDLYFETPSIAFTPTHNYMFIDYTFRPTRREGGEVVYLPIISANLPELWIGLAHEIGHFNRENIVNRFIQELEEIESIDLASNDKKDRLEEIYCDLFALATLGPCYLTFYILESMIDRSIYSPLLVTEEGHSPSHPTHISRILIMKTFLEKFMSYDTKILTSLSMAVDTIKDIDEKFIEDKSYNNLVTSILREEQNILSRKDKICCIVKNLINKSERYNLLCEKDIKLSFRLVKSLIDREEDGYYIPIGTIRREQDITKILQEIRNLKEISRTESSIGDQLDNLFNMLDEEPVKMQVLFNAFQILKLKHMNEFIESFKDVENDSDAQRLINNYKEKMIKRNEALLKSIEMSTICKFYKSRR